MVLGVPAGDQEEAVGGDELSVHECAVCVAPVSFPVLFCCVWGLVRVVEGSFANTLFQIVRADDGHEGLRFRSRAPRHGNRREAGHGEARRGLNGDFSRLVGRRVLRNDYSSFRLRGELMGKC